MDHSFCFTPLAKTCQPRIRPYSLVISPPPLITKAPLRKGAFEWRLGRRLLAHHILLRPRLTARANPKGKNAHVGDSPRNSACLPETDSTKHVEGVTQARKALGVMSAERHGQWCIGQQFRREDWFWFCGRSRPGGVASSIIPPSFRIGSWGDLAGSRTVYPVSLHHENNLWAARPYLRLPP